MAQPSGSPNRTGPRGGKGGYSRYKANNLKFGTPLPILLPTSPLHPQHVEPEPFSSFAAPSSSSSSSSSSSTSIRYLLRSYLSGSSNGSINPRVVGTYDAMTRSVWVTDKAQRESLFERGFFGKGNLSRSDPSWAIRRAKELEGERDGHSTLTSEEVTALRRKERKQFKIDRAQAMLNASLAAEALLTRQASEPGTPDLENPMEPTHASSTNRVSVSTNSTYIPSIDDYAHALPEGESRLTPQTFLVRPTRPDQRIGQRAREAAAKEAQTSVPKVEPEDKDQEQKEPIEVEDLEHLQLNLEEAFFLSWAVGCLSVINPETNNVLSPRDLLRLALDLPYPLRVPTTTPSSSFALRPDNPFLVSYVAYHHYRSLGWVVKTGLKFCVDWLLYKRGLVFSHAEFALMVIPHYANKTLEASKPFILANDEPMSWQWLNTVNRVNSQVKKTLILCYVTIHSGDPVTEQDLRNPVGLLGKYSVREVTIRRFVPARMRD